jgi:hypothetical protein
MRLPETEQGVRSCRGLVPWVPWVAGYDPKIWIHHSSSEIHTSSTCLAISIEAQELQSLTPTAIAQVCTTASGREATTYALPGNVGNKHAIDVHACQRVYQDE